MIKYPEGCTLVELDSILIEDRAREKFGKDEKVSAHVQELADSINEIGLIHPPVLRKSDNKLCAGNCRIRAMVLLGLKEFPILYREDMSESQLKQIELHENIRRFGMTWQEKVLLIADTHKARVKENALIGKTWFQKETGELFNYSTASVCNALMIADHLEDEEILKSEKITDALKVLTARSDKLATAESVKRFGEQIQPQERLDDNTIQVFDPDKDVGDFKVSTDLVTPNEEPSLLKTVQFDLGKMFFQGDCIEIMSKMMPLSVDHVVTDIPYGINMENLDINNKDDIKDQHEIEENVELMPKFLKEAYRIIKTGYCVFWYDLDHHEKLQAWAREAGFKVQRWPLVWCKTHNCQNKSAQFNYTKATEFAMVCRKGSETTLIKPVNKNFFTCDGAIERKAYGNHPFIKPMDAWKFILEHIAFQGQTVLDPFAGQFSSIRAMVNMGLNPRAIELVPYHFVKGVENLMTQFNEITQNQAEFINNPIANIDPESIK